MILPSVDLRLDIEGVSTSRTPDVLVCVAPMPQGRSVARLDYLASASQTNAAAGPLYHGGIESGARQRLALGGSQDLLRPRRRIEKFDFKMGIGAPDGPNRPGRQGSKRGKSHIDVRGLQMDAVPALGAFRQPPGKISYFIDHGDPSTMQFGEQLPIVWVNTWEGHQSFGGRLLPRGAAALLRKAD
jgi:hypothetical protein